MNSQQPTAKPLSAVEALARAEEYREEGMPRLAATLEAYAALHKVARAARARQDAQQDFMAAVCDKSVSVEATAARGAIVRECSEAVDLALAAAEGLL